MGLRTSILKQGSDTAFRRTFLRVSLSDGALPVMATTQREVIQEALDSAGAIPLRHYTGFVDSMDDAALNRSLTEMAHTNSNSFKRVIADLHSTDQAALRAFYAQSDEVVQRQMVAAFDGGSAFFRAGGDKQAVEEMVEQQIKNSPDGGKSWFIEKVWPNVTFTNLWRGSVVGVGATMVWAILGFTSAITGLSIPELFGGFFKFLTNPAGALCASEEGCWQLTDMGKGFFGLIALVGIGAAIKFVKVLKIEPSEA